MRKIIAYISGGEENWSYASVDATKITHINYAFAVPTEQFEYVFDGATTARRATDVIELKRKNSGLKVLLSYGGWGGCQWFHNGARPDNVKKFADNCVLFAMAHGFDGVDIDWEYPGQKGAGNPHGSDDKQNFTNYLYELRNACNKFGVKYLTIAAGGDATFLRHVEGERIHELLDWINIMGYDLYHGGDYSTGHQCNLRTVAGDKRGLSGDFAVNRFLDCGTPSEKIVLGIPFYGRMWTGTTGLFQPAETVGEIIHYRGIREKYLNDPKTKVERLAECRAPYLQNGAVFISYEDAESIAEKWQYVNQRQLGGIMFWELPYDSGELLEAVDKYRNS